MFNIKWGIGIENETNIFFNEKKYIDLRDIKFLYSNRELRLSTNKYSDSVDNEITNFKSNFLYEILGINEDIDCCLTNTTFKYPVTIQLPELFKIYNSILESYFSEEKIPEHFNWVSKDTDGIRNYFEIQTPVSLIQTKINDNIDMLLQIKNDIETDINLFLNTEQTILSLINDDKITEKNTTEVVEEKIPIDLIKAIVNVDTLTTVSFPKFGSERFIYNVKETNSFESKEYFKNIVTNKTGSYHLNLTLPYNQNLLHELLKVELIDKLKIEEVPVERIKIFKSLKTEQKIYRDSIDKYTKEKINDLFKIEKLYFEFMEREHLIWAKYIQLIEPLLIACFGGPDSLVYQNKYRDKKFTQGSLRQLMEHDIGALSTDLNCGFPDEREPKINPYIEKNYYSGELFFYKRPKMNKFNYPLWRDILEKTKNFNYVPINFLKNKSIKKSSLTTKEEKIINSKINNYFPVGTDFRRDTSKIFIDYLKLKKKVLENITKDDFGDFTEELNNLSTFGFEFRMLDNFDSKYLKNILEFLFMLAEESTSKISSSDDMTLPPGSSFNPYTNEDMHIQMAKVFIKGNTTELTLKYREYLNTNLDIPNIPDGLNCYQATDFIYQELQKKYIINNTNYTNSKYVKYVIDKRTDILTMPNSNQEQIDYHITKFEDSKTDISYKNKYLKYKNKYLKLRNKITNQAK